MFLDNYCIYCPLIKRGNGKPTTHDDFAMPILRDFPVHVWWHRMVAADGADNSQVLGSMLMKNYR